ncbi:MAG: von Willebrand factor type A domain-containing protein, partial [Opitutae bacterium]
QEKLLWYGRTKAKEETVAGSENAKTAQAPRDSLESFDDAGVLNEAVKIAGIYPAIDSDDAEDDKKILEDHGVEVPVQLPKPKPEVVTAKNRWSTFSLNVSDASFRLCEASLRNGRLPAPHMVRAEEFINAFDYRDPAPAKGAPLAFAWERSRHPFAHNRDLVRFSIQTAAEGRESGQPLNLVLAIDNSGSMERSDRVAILKEALKVLAAKLRAEDTVSVIAFSRTPRLWLDGQKGESARQKLTNFPGLVPQGGTNIESALDLGYSTALKHFISGGNNRLILLTDGAANLGAIVPNSLRNKVESYRKRGVALDCFGIGWDGYNDHLMEALARNGDGRYAFLNSATDVERDFGRKLAGALSVSAADVKVQVVFNPARVK